MILSEDVFLTDSIEIHTTPDKIFSFLCAIVDDESYCAWHPKDHVKFRWLKGLPWQEGSIGYAEEYFVGKLHKIKFIVTETVINKRIKYILYSKLLRRFIPGFEFSIESKGSNSVFTASIHGRIPLIQKVLAKKRLEEGLESVRKHMKEEGENMKLMLESK